MFKRERSADWSMGHPAKQQAVTGDQISDPYLKSSSAQDVMSVFDNAEFDTSVDCECHVTGCNQSFSSTADYEEHYRSCHSYVCRYCLRFYPTNHLLEIHLLENHDSLFSLLAKKKPMFHCLEETCRDQFVDAKSRQDHMTICHGYPPNFQFDRRQGARAVDMSGGREESRDLDVAGQRKSRLTSRQPDQTLVPDKINFGIGGSELFALAGTSQLEPSYRGSSVPVPKGAEDPMDDT